MSARYVAHQADLDGTIQWSAEENDTWRLLVQRQQSTIHRYACTEYLSGLEALDLSVNHIPQLADIDRVLLSTTGWQTQPVPALIDFSTFFSLLSQRKFPVATFIRRQDEMDYLQEPDIFHEIFGHCPLLTNPAFARFTQRYGELGAHASKEDRTYLARLYWFTVEFGLLQSHDGLASVYGGGILSSPKEMLYALSSERPQRQPFDLMTVLRTPYRIDILQPLYFYLGDVEELFEIAKLDIMGSIQKAKKLGLLPAKFENKKTNGEHNVT